MKIPALLFVSIILSGCSLFTPPLEHPVIEEKLNRGLIDDSSAVGTLSLTPERRVVLVKFAEKGKNGKIISPSRFCAEAPTEVGADVARLTKAAATLEKPEEVKAGLEAITATTVGNAVLNKRTQGLQLFQSSSYFLCQMYMNEAINKEQLMLLQLQTLNTAGQLINQEVPLLYEKNTEATKAAFKHLDLSPIMNQLLQLNDPKKTGAETEKDGDGNEPTPPTKP